MYNSGRTWLLKEQGTPETPGQDVDRPNSAEEVKKALLRAWEGVAVAPAAPEVAKPGNSEAVINYLMSTWDGTEELEVPDAVEKIKPSHAETLKKSLMALWNHSEAMEVPDTKDEAVVPDKEPSIVEDMRRSL